MSTVELNTSLNYICVGPFMSLDDEQIIKEKIKSIAQNKLINLNAKMILRVRIKYMNR